MRAHKINPHMTNLSASTTSQTQLNQKLPTKSIVKPQRRKIPRPSGRQGEGEAEEEVGIEEAKEAAEEGAAEAEAAIREAVEAMAKAKKADSETNLTTKKNA